MSASRIDRWLFGVRLFKSRSLAAEAVSGGKVHVNDARVRPSHTVKPGDLV
ncbi:MAG: RNA-binding protein, partial [Gammaproteobacteria bacterium]|nr:RNA-binding protein [Gammaproteobacteria bacterium]